MAERERIIEVRGLKKSYGPVEAVRSVDFYVERGRMFALLGPNGAGKSTIINMICTFLRPDGGEVQVDGHRLGQDDDAIRRRIGVVFQNSLLDPLLTVEENLAVRASLYGLRGSRLQEQVEFAIAATDCTAYRRRRYGKLSGGQRRRADIARALTHTPDILFLDEPTTGLDPQTRRSVWETIQRLQADAGMTVFLTTHYMEEAAEADYIIIIDEGRIAAKGTPAQLKQEHSATRLILHCHDAAQCREQLERIGGSFHEQEQRLVVPLDDSLAAIPILNALEGKIRSFELVPGSLDDVFINITGRRIRE